MIRTNVDRVFRSIVAQNALHNLNSIPHSDVFYKEMESLYGLTKSELDIIISILRESHKILVMEISREDKNRKLEKVLGYVDADLVTLQKLKDVFHRALSDDYEKENGKKKTAHQIIRELIPRLQYINHTPLGRVLNKAIMLDEYIHMLEKDYKEYTEEWKDDNIQIQLDINSELLRDFTDKKKQEVPAEEDEPVQKPKAAYVRAVDTPQHREYLEQVSSGSVNKLLQIYGVDFFFRVNLRKCNFDFISQALDTGVIDRKKDLMDLKEMLKTIKGNIGSDAELEKHYDEIMSLDRKISRLISFSSK
ncbi:MAG: hypothetical protein GXY14_16090 [Spirochaetes bacterium]|nr:hypothetical protein [Spirochaetota bacterium]